MKLPLARSRYLYVFLCLVFSYSLLISTIAPFALQSVHGESVKRNKPDSSNSTPLLNNGTRPAAQPSSGASTALTQNPSQARAREGEVLIRFRASASESDRDAIAAGRRAKRKKLRGESDLEKLEVSGGQSPEDLALQLKQDPAVEFAEPNFIIKRDQLPASTGGAATNDPRFADQWALRNTGQNGGQYGSDVGTTTAWQTTTGLQSTVIAVIDSGIDFGHPDLINNRWTNSAPGPNGDLYGWDYITDSGAIKDEQGHGTAAAGIIAAQGNNGLGLSGVMWQASLMSLRVLDNTGTGDIAHRWRAGTSMIHKMSTAGRWKRSGV